jgi:hypothetical protein
MHNEREVTAAEFAAWCEHLAASEPDAHNAPAAPTLTNDLVMISVGMMLAAVTLTATRFLGGLGG